MNFRQLLVLFFLLALSASVLAVVQESSMKIFAVTSEGQGLSADLLLKITSGSGKVWSSVAPLVGTTTQNAEIAAVNLAKNYSSEVGLHDYLFEIKSEASLVEGPSAGSAMALLVVSALKDKRIPKEVGMTGTIAEDGSIGPVGGVFEKSQEAANIGIKLFMIPRGEARQTVKLSSGVQNISLPDYALKEWGMKVVEVSNLDEAFKLAFSNIEKIDINKSQKAAELVFTPQPILQASSLQPLQKLTKNYLAETKELINSARNSLSTTLITDTSIINGLLSQLRDTEDALNEAQTLYDNNYLYSAANYAFLARVNALTIKDIADNPSILSENSTALKLKIDSLKEKVQALEEELSKEIPVENIEWFAASQQRLMWARINLEQLSQPATVIIINGVQQGSDETIIKKIQDFEFAQAWFDISTSFYNFGKNSEAFAKPNDFFKTELNDYIVQAENGLTIVQEPGEDITRRLTSAKIEREFKWYLGGAFDSVSALALINAQKEIEGKDINALEAMLDSKIKSLSAEIKDLNFEPVWANLYLDHARYYLNGAMFYYANAQGSRASEMLKSGIGIVFLAESNLKVAKQAFVHYSSIPVEELINSQSKGFGVSVKITQQENEFLLYAVIILSAGLVFAIISIVVLARKKPGWTSDVFEFEELSGKQKALAQSYAEGKITAGEFLTESRKLSEKISAIEESAKQKSRKTVEVDVLHSKLAVLSSSSRALKRDYNSGKILKADYKSALDNIKREMASLQEIIRSKETVQAVQKKTRKESNALKEIAKQIKKPAKTLLQAKAFTEKEPSAKKTKKKKR